MRIATGGLLIDSHDRPVDDAVWGLYELTIGLIGATPTLIERDADVPPWDALHAEARRAEAVMAAVAKIEVSDATAG